MYQLVSVASLLTSAISALTASLSTNLTADSGADLGTAGTFVVFEETDLVTVVLGAEVCTGAFRSLERCIRSGKIGIKNIV